MHFSSKLFGRASIWYLKGRHLDQRSIDDQNDDNDIDEPQDLLEDVDNDKMTMSMKIKVFLLNIKLEH